MTTVSLQRSSISSIVSELSIIIDQFTLQIKEMQALDQPSGKFVENYIIGVRGDLNDDDAKYTNGPSWDWALIMNMDKLDQLVRDIPQYPWGRIILVSWASKSAGWSH